jgi:adenylosuccinate synthase
MPATIVVGGQYGSEGKGKVVALRALRSKSPLVVRCGGPNSGHTVTIGDLQVGLRQVPTGVINPASSLAIAAGCVVDEVVLLRELDLLKLGPTRVVVDRRAVLIEEADRESERDLVGEIGSTASGTGAALVRRMQRRPGVRLAADSERLRGRVRIATVGDVIHEHLDNGGDVIVEGTQGFGLSLLHSKHYPHCTSRDTTAAAFAMEAGLSPRQVDEVVVVLRTFPIRVGGNSGRLHDEISWEEVQAISGAPECVPETTTVTGRLRRVARLDLDLVRDAVRYNRPTSLAVMGIDRVDHRCHRSTTLDGLTTQGKSFIQKISDGTDTPVELVGTGFDTSDVVQNLTEGKRWLNSAR